MIKSGHIDLHTHTTCSDGDLSPHELIKKAKDYGLLAMSITDHDTIKAFSPELFDYSRKLGVELITGIELSTIDDEQNKHHIVGLMIDINNNGLQRKIEEIQFKRKNRMATIIDLMKIDGWKISKKRLFDNNQLVTKSILAKEIIANKRNQEKFLDAFDGNVSEGKLIEALMIKGKPYYVGSERLKTKEAVEIIHKSGGVAILAHPSFDVMKGFNLINLCDKAKRLEIDGLESISVQFDEMNGRKEFECREKIEKYAKTNNMLISGGSDYHGSSDDKYIDLGFKNYNWKIPYKMLVEIQKYRESRL